MHTLFCTKCGFISEPDVAMKPECPVCKEHLKLTSDIDLCLILKMIRLHKDINIENTKMA